MTAYGAYGRGSGEEYADRAARNGDDGDGDGDTYDPGDAYRGPATLFCDGHHIPVRAHLAGHVEPYDGTYRWYARLDPEPTVTTFHRSGRTRVSLLLPDGRELPATLAELNPWGGARLTGKGRPPPRT